MDSHNPRKVTIEQNRIADKAQASTFDLLRCPVDGSRLRRDGSWLFSLVGRRYPIAHGIPILLRDDVADTLWVASASRDLGVLLAAGKSNDTYAVQTLGLTEEERQWVTAQLAANPLADVDPVVSAMVAATNGILYKKMARNMACVPIPVFTVCYPPRG